MLAVGILTTQKFDHVEHPHLCTTSQLSKARSPASSVASTERMTRAEGLWWNETIAAPAAYPV